ncbi:MAG: hypothetical protein AAF614_41615 [Chloroflexota bacterium]
MSPLFWQGDEIVLAKVPANELAIGEVITVAEEAGFLTHRYWGKTKDGLLLTKGDRSLVFDMPWKTAVLVGRVVARKRGTKTLRLDAGRGNWLVRVLGKITAVEQRLLANHNPNNLLVKLARRLFLATKWLPTLLIR